MPPSKKKPRKWCDVCRGEDELFSCSTCERAFHCECVRLKKAPDSTWRCNDCCEGDDVVVDDDEKQRRKLHDARQQQLNGLKRHCQVGASLNLTQHSHRHSSARSHAARGTLRCMHLGKRAVSVSDITLPWPSLEVQEIQANASCITHGGWRALSWRCNALGIASSSY